TVRDARRLVSLQPPDAVARSVSPGAPLIEVTGMTASHGSAVALRDVDLCVRTGEVVAAMGRSGAGKTTLLRSVAGVLAPLLGTLRVGGHAPRPGIDVALCPQEPDAVLFADTVADEVRVTLRARGLDPGLANEVLADLGIDGLAESHPRDLSAGQRLLVAV